MLLKQTVVMVIFFMAINYCYCWFSSDIELIGPCMRSLFIRSCRLHPVIFWLLQSLVSIGSSILALRCHALLMTMSCSWPHDIDIPHLHFWIIPSSPIWCKRWILLLSWQAISSRHRLTFYLVISIFYKKMLLPSLKLNFIYSQHQASLFALVKLERTCVNKFWLRNLN